MTEHLPTVSVCIPVFNAEAFIGEAVQSVLDQLFQDWELVVVDNASTDKTVEEIRRFDDPRIRFFQNETNLGPEKNWNRAIALAAGRYTKLLCADDILYPDCLALQVAAMEDPVNGKPALVFSSRDFIDERGRKILSASSYPPGLLDGAGLLRSILCAGKNLIGEPHTTLIRSDVLRAVGGFSTEIPYYTDLEMWCRLIYGRTVFSIGKPLGAFRVSSEAWSADLADKQLAQGQQFFRQIAGRYALPKVESALREGLFRARLNAFLRRLFYVYLAVRKKLQV
jgi:glycosyltransferase involved in cell wall biosynthesis